MIIKIDNKSIGEKNPVFIVAELSANHNQDINIAKKTIKAAAESGADGIKLQTYTPDTMTIDCDNEYFRIKQGTIWDGQNLYDLYKTAYTPWKWHKELKDYAEKLGLILFSTPFDKSAVDFLEKLDVPAYKIASFEITDIPLIEYIAKMGKPIIFSTGIAKKEDIELVVEACKKHNNEKLVILKCTSAYPAPVEEANLKTIPDIADRFQTIVGLSDHTLGSDVVIASVALGAKVIEKHFIIDRSQGGPDSKFSMEPEEFRQMVDSVRTVEKALGKVTYELTRKAENGRELSRSLFVVEDVKKGQELTERNVRSIRPGYGMHPKHYFEVMGKKSSKDIKRGTPLDWDLIQ